MPLATLAANYEASRPTRTVECPVCFDFVKQNKFVFDNKCMHMACRACTYSYIREHIEDQGRVDIRCFHVGKEGERCESMYEQDYIRKILRGRAGLARFEYLSKLHNSTTCPKCNRAQDRFQCRTNLLTAQCKCHNCKNEFCFRHGNAHKSTVTCEEYEADVRAQDAESVKLIEKSAVVCPSCKAPTTKIDGCNRMECTRCRVVWCYGCGNRIRESFPYNSAHPQGRACSGYGPGGMEFAYQRPYVPPPQVGIIRRFTTGLLHMMQVLIMLTFLLLLLVGAIYMVIMHFKTILQWAFMIFLVSFVVGMVVTLVDAAMKKFIAFLQGCSYHTQRTFKSSQQRTAGTDRTVAVAKATSHGDGDHFRVHRYHHHRNAKHRDATQSRAPTKSKGRS